MSKKSIKEEEKKKKFNFVEEGVVIEAANLEEAQEILSKKE